MQTLHSWLRIRSNLYRTVSSARWYQTRFSKKWEVKICCLDIVVEILVVGSWKLVSYGSRVKVLVDARYEWSVNVWIGGVFGPGNQSTHCTRSSLVRSDLPLSKGMVPLPLSKGMPRPPSRAMELLHSRTPLSSCSRLNIAPLSWRSSRPTTWFYL